MAAQEITHEGIIEGIENQKVKVKFTSHSACADCHAKGICSVSESDEKELEIPVKETIYNIGDKVDIILAISSGFRALFYGYILPFLIVLTILILVLSITQNEVISGILALLSLVPYYVILKVTSPSFRKNFEFTIRKSG